MALRRFDGTVEYAVDDATGELHIVSVAGDGTATDLGAVKQGDGTTLAVTTITVTSTSATIQALLTAASGAMNAATKRITLVPVADVYGAIGAAAVATGRPLVTSNIAAEILCKATTDLRLIAGGDVACLCVQEG